QYTAANNHSLHHALPIITTMLDGMTAPDQSAPEKASDQGQDTTTLQATKDEGAEAGETGEPKDASAKEASETGDVEDVDYAGKTDGKSTRLNSSHGSTSY